MKKSRRAVEQQSGSAAERKWGSGVIWRAVFSSAVLLFCCSFSAAADRPNILFIISDDHAYQAVSCYDGTRNQTPNIDRIAKEGMRFDRCYVTNSLCGPSRACILTGKYSHKNGFYDNRSTFDGSQLTFPKLLREAGYQTAIVGKWHLVSEQHKLVSVYGKPEYAKVQADLTAALGRLRKELQVPANER